MNVRTYTGDEIDKLGGGRGRWLKLSDHGDTTTIAFMSEPVYWLDHFGKGPCTGEGCPYCHDGDRPSATGAVTVFDFNYGGGRIWQRSRAWFRSTYEDMVRSLAKKGKHIGDYAFDIERHGARGDRKTRYPLGLPDPLTEEHWAAMKGVEPFTTEELTGSARDEVQESPGISYEDEAPELSDADARF